MTMTLTMSPMCVPWRRNGKGTERESIWGFTDVPSLQGTHIGDIVIVIVIGFYHATSTKTRKVHILTWVKQGKRSGWYHEFSFTPDNRLLVYLEKSVSRNEVRQETFSPQIKTWTTMSLILRKCDASRSSVTSFNHTCHLLLLGSALVVVICTHLSQVNLPIYGCICLLRYVHLHP